MTTPSSPGRLTARSASFIGSMTFAGRAVERLAALAQILLIAAFLGTTTQADLYFIASIVPLMIGGLLGEAFYASILPPLSSRRSRDEIVGLGAAGFWVAAGVALLATACYLVAVAVVVSVAVPAGSSSLGPWLAFAPVGILFSLGAYVSAILLRFERYSWPPFRSAVSAVVGVVLTALALVLTEGVLWVALAVTAGYAAAFALLVAEVVAVVGWDVFARPTRACLRELRPLGLKAAAAVVGGLLGGQVFVFFERVLAASLGVGAVSAISYARGIAFTPTVLAQSVALGIYPGMLRAQAERNTAYLRGSFIAGLRVTLFVGAAAAAYLAWFASDIAHLVFDRGNLPEKWVLEIGRVLRVFCLALVASMVITLTARVFGALNRFRAIVLAQGLSLAVYLVLAPLLRPWQGPTGLALALGVAETCGALFAVTLVWRQIGSKERPLRSLLAPSALWRIVAVVAAVGLCERAFQVANVTDPAVAVVAGLAVSAAAAGALLWSAPWAELEGARAFVRRRLRPA